MSKHAYLMIINGSLLFILLGWLMSYAGQTEAIDLPGPAFGTTTATHLSLVTYPHGNTQSAVTVAKTLDENGRANTTSTVQTLNTAAIPPHCQISSTYASPNGQYLLWQYNCEASLFIQLQNLHDTTDSLDTLSRGYFLAWSPDSHWFLFREIDTDQIQLVSVATTNTQPLALPFGTYNATFTPDGQSVLFAANKGLGFGSTLGLLHLADQEIVWQRQFPQQIVAFPSWSPDASQMAYILMPDSNVPFTTGELWLANDLGKPTNLLDTKADAGHGYPPRWSPDGQTVAFVRRENGESQIANHKATALHSNIYLADIGAVKLAGEIVNNNAAVVGYQPTPIPPEPAPAVSATKITSFTATQVYDIAWSPDGTQLAFTAGEAVWLVAPGQGEAWQVSAPDVPARHPAWIATDSE